ncbi:hypothetical protein BN946_scf184665.g20 [Trametes cinnabarina]|uniref:Large ribosomal subunit protein eL14 domain-containing protein n=1 Tax=Pycnoporus cinnabarinus TaxID=5643 RepID=A0A060SU85_PYCCI|nr:hypothetical protein BN946_scf184665.g20 [Trametes cinnabarina]
MLELDSEAASSARSAHVSKPSLLPAQVFDDDNDILKHDNMPVSAQLLPSLPPHVPYSLGAPLPPRAAGTGVIRKHLEKDGTVEKWQKSSWAQKREAIAKRRTLNDFERFRVMVEKKQRRDQVRKALAKASA